MTTPPDRDPRSGWTRRTFLQSCGLAASAVLAGCFSDAAGTDTAPDGSRDSGESGTTPPPDTGESPTASESTPELDLREANVTAVEFEGSDGAYEFHVTLYHDDDGEEGYADWWQVESLRGDQLGRRTLLHPHSTDPFTRSETIDVPAGTTCVVVRGHDQTHGYGGQAMLVNLETGGTRAVDRGSDRASFDQGDCP